MPTTISLIEEQALEAIAPRKLHQIFTLPATDDHGPLKVSYAIAGPELGEEVPTIFFCGGMFGTRWMAMSYNFLAEKERVRMIFIDRPEFGASTAVPTSQRIPVFLETVPALLKHLHISKIHIAAHSAGTIYALNVLWHHPELLSPTNPTIHFFSPWVHQSISGVSFLSAAAMLPNSLLNHWNGVTAFMIQKASPVLASSSGALGSFSGMFKSASSEDETKRAEEERRSLEYCGVSLERKKELDKQILKYAFSENTKGGNEEARLCLKSLKGSNWDAAEDYPALIAKLKDVWVKKVQEGGEKLRVRIVFGQEDIMIGVKGRRYWEDCWTQEKCGQGMEVESKELEGGDHDSLLDATKGVIPEMFAAVKAVRN